MSRQSLHRAAYALAAASVVALVAVSSGGAADGQPLIVGQQNLSTNITSVRGVANGPAFYATNEWGNGISAIAYPPYAIGVYGIHQATTGALGAPGVRGDNNSTEEGANGVEGHAAAAGGSGVYGVNTAFGGTGVSGQGFAIGVYGNGNNYGLQGETTSGIGVRGNSGNRGVVGTLGVAPCPGSYGVGGCVGNAADGVQGVSSLGNGVHGVSSGGFGVYGSSDTSDGVHGVGYLAGLAGSSVHGNGVYGESSGSGGAAAVYGNALTGSTYAGYFIGTVSITGTLTAATKNFKIDDPLDPAHKYLVHSSVESSEQMNVYSGNVTTDGKGFATVTMPRWFQALNRDFRYQLTVMGKQHWDAKAAVWEKVAGNRFTIRTDQPSVEVSWQVTGVRHDPYASAHPLTVELRKPQAEQGTYLNPEPYGKAKTAGIGYRKPPGPMK